MHPLRQKLPTELVAWDKDRTTGRSTIIALETLAKAMKNPFTKIYVTDHVRTDEADRALFIMCCNMIQDLRFEHFKTGKDVIGDHFITFG